MANETPLGRVTAPYQKYIFHFLPAIPVSVGLTLIFYETEGVKTFFKATIDYLAQKPTLDGGMGLLGFTLFLILLVLCLAGAFFIGMVIDAVRHTIEEMFLVAKWSEYNILQEFKQVKGSRTTVEHKWSLFEQVNASEYFYTEFFGNASISLAFFWLVLIWLYGYNNSNFYLYLAWLLLIFLVRPFFASVLWHLPKISPKWQKKMKRKRKNKVFRKRFSYALKNLLYRMLDFSATCFSIIIIIILAFLPKELELFSFDDKLPFKFYIICILLTSITFDMYITRYRRYQEFLKTLFKKAKTKN